jgi:signal transduction histidine kinase
MSRMVDDLLSLAKIEGRESIKPNNQINIFQLLSNIQELFLARSKKNLIDFNTK